LVEGRDELGDRLGDRTGGAPWQVMARVRDEPQAGAGQFADHPLRAHDGHDLIGRVGEQQHRYPDGRQRALQLGEFAEQRPLLDEEGAPPRLSAGVLLPPDLQAEVLAGV
jgi:hypothetical protein